MRDSCEVVGFIAWGEGMRVHELPGPFAQDELHQAKKRLLDEMRASAARDDLEVVDGCIVRKILPHLLLEEEVTASEIKPS